MTTKYKVTGTNETGPYEITVIGLTLASQTAIRLSKKYTGQWSIVTEDGTVAAIYVDGRRK